MKYEFNNEKEEEKMSCEIWTPSSSFSATDGWLKKFVKTAPEELKATETSPGLTHYYDFLFVDSCSVFENEG